MRIVAGTTICLFIAPSIGLAQPASAEKTRPSNVGMAALVGAAAVAAPTIAASAACGLGCENDMPLLVPVASAAIGAGLASLATYLGERQTGDSRPVVPVNPYFRAGLLIGAGRSAVRFTSAMSGTATGPAYIVGVPIGRWLTLRAELVTYDVRLAPGKEGRASGDVLNNLVPATSRAAGPVRGIEARRIDFAFSEAIELHLPSKGRVRAGVLAGFVIRGQGNRDYYDETTQRGKYKVLEFESPHEALMVGANLEIAATRHLTIGPSLRWTLTGDPAQSLTWGLGAGWRF